jgi:hypothetical protein
MMWKAHQWNWRYETRVNDMTTLSGYHWRDGERTTQFYHYVGPSNTKSVNSINTGYRAFSALAAWRETFNSAVMAFQQSGQLIVESCDSLFDSMWRSSCHAYLIQTNIMSRNIQQCGASIATVCQHGHHSMFESFQHYQEIIFPYFSRWSNSMLGLFQEYGEEIKLVHWNDDNNMLELLQHSTAIFITHCIVYSNMLFESFQNYGQVILVVCSTT